MATEECPECGSRRLEGSTHCPACGHAFPEKPQPAPSSVLGQAAEPANTVAEESFTARPVPAQKQRNKAVPVIGGLVLVLVLAAVGAAALSSSGSSGGGSQASGSQAHEQAPEDTSSATPVESGTWIGEAGTDNIALSLSLDADQASGILRVRKASGAVGSWYVDGSDQAGDLQLSPGAWISRPSGWSAAGLHLVHHADGSMDGSTSGGKSVTLEQISTGMPDATAVADDWRNALAMDESTAQNTLEQRRQEAASTRDGMDGSWVAQVASGCEGLTTQQWPLTNASILATHARLDQELGAITVAWDDIATSSPENCPGTTMWVSLVPKEFNSAHAALRWCYANTDFTDSCAARYIVPRGVAGTKIEY